MTDIQPGPPSDNVTVSYVSSFLAAQFKVPHYAYVAKGVVLLHRKVFFHTLVLLMP